MGDSMSPSVDGGEYDDDDHEGTSAAKPGRKKGPANAAARRDQNRIAQREFRLRKQQRIRDLEARVEILSGTKEETHHHTRVIIQGLMEENSRLRNLLRDLGSFIGDGLGGPLLDRTGWTMEKFKDFTHRADSDAAYEAFVRAKNAATGDSPAGGAHTSTNTQPSPDDSSARKRKRDSTSTNLDNDNGAGPSKRSFSSSMNGGGMNILESGRRASSPNELPSILPSHSHRGMMDQSSSNFSTLVSTLSSSSSAPFLDIPVNTNPGGMMAGYRIRDSPHGSAATPTSNVSATEIANRRQQEFQENEPKRNEAGKLIKYHLDNYRRNSDYFLPASLRPTLVQRTVEHDPLIDGIIYPEIRDRMILLKDQYDLAKCLTEFLWTTIVHGDDVLMHTNWELGEDWLRNYGFLVEESVLQSVNKWRRLRGEPAFTIREINPDVAQQQ